MWTLPIVLVTTHPTVLSQIEPREASAPARNCHIKSAKTVEGDVHLSGYFSSPVPYGGSIVTVILIGFVERRPPKGPRDLIKLDLNFLTAWHPHD